MCMELIYEMLALIVGKEKSFQWFSPHFSMHQTGLRKGNIQIADCHTHFKILTMF